MSHEKTWKNPSMHSTNERGQSERATYCMIPTTYMTFQKRQKLGEQWKDLWLPGAEEEISSGAQRIFRAMNM